MGRPDFGRLTAHLAPPVGHSLHDDDADVVDGDIAEAVDKTKCYIQILKHHHQRIII